MSASIIFQGIGGAVDDAIAEFILVGLTPIAAAVTTDGTVVSIALKPRSSSFAIKRPSTSYTRRGSRSSFKVKSW